MKYSMLLLALLSPSVLSQGLTTTLESWNLSQYPIEKILELKAYDKKSNRDERIASRRHFVYLERGNLKLRIEDNPEVPGVWTFGDIQYSSIDKGEFGGELGFTKNGSYQKLLEGNIQSLIRDGDLLYVLEGLDHFPHGNVYLYRDLSNPDNPTKISALPEEPKAAFLEEQARLIIVGEHGILSIFGYEYLRILYWDAFWSGIFLWGPTSIVEYQGKYVVGLPQGVAVVDVNSNDTPNVKLYLNNDFIKSNPHLASTAGYCAFCSMEPSFLMIVAATLVASSIAALSFFWLRK